jgi:hypothetical protein
LVATSLPEQFHQSSLYIAPADLPVPANVRVIATSATDSASNVSAQLIVTSDIGAGISSASTGVELGAKQSFAAHQRRSARHQRSMEIERQLLSERLRCDRRQFSCTVPAVNTEFTVRTGSGP